MARATVLHVLTYMVVGALSYRFIARYVWEGPILLPGMRDIQSPAVQMMILPAQVVRGLLIALALLPIRPFLMDSERFGGLMIASILLLIGSFAGISGQIEVWVYTTGFNLRLFLAHLPEIVIQSLLFGYLLLAWERRASAKHSDGASA
ncbi:MAG TPA: hypothetical protein VJ463_10165 [Geothrix sp.]|nr:hypothetical protein [Geothrix sp.]